MSDLIHEIHIIHTYMHVVNEAFSKKSMNVRLTRGIHAMLSIIVERNISDCVSLFAHIKSKNAFRFQLKYIIAFN